MRTLSSHILGARRTCKKKKNPITIHKMNTLTSKDIKEIETRINSRVCPYCGGNISVELKNNNNDLITYKVISFCCEKYNGDINRIFSEEYNSLIQRKMDNIMRM